MDYRVDSDESYVTIIEDDEQVTQSLCLFDKTNNFFV